MIKKAVVFLWLTMFLTACVFTRNLVTATPTAMDSITLTTSPSAQPTMTSTPTITITFTPTLTATPTATATPQDLYYVVKAGDTLTGIAAKYGLNVTYLAGINKIPDMNLIYVGQILRLTGVLLPPEPTITVGKQIIVQLSVQKVFVYEDGELINTFIVSTGVTAYPTRLGEYKIYEKVELTRMKGPGYDYPNVPWAMYFDERRSFHGTYWHNNFGRPMSHGCVNMQTPDAKWLYDWAEMGTSVLVIV